MIPNCKLVNNTNNETSHVKEVIPVSDNLLIV